MFLIHIGPDWRIEIRLKDFKSNIYLEQSDEIVYTFLHVETRNYKSWYKNSRADVARNGCDTLIRKWMDKWMDELSWVFANWCKFNKVKNYFNNFWVVVVKNVHGTLILKCMDEPGWFFACYTYLRELKNTLIVIGRAW